jgi:enoyl-CoA hydratase/carnithine racemase
VVALTRPDKHNALDGAMFEGILAAADEVAATPGVRAVVLYGEGPSFCSGLDVASLMSGPISLDDILERDGRRSNLAQRACTDWIDMPVPVIAAVHGNCFGGGLQIALGADIRIVHPDTKLSVREVHWGLVPDMTGTFILSQLVRPDVAKELTFTARVFSGTEAYELGLATRLSDNPYDDAMALAVDIAGRSPGAVRGSKALFNRLTTPGAAEQFAAERSVIGAQIGSANQIEAVKAGFENRSPVFADLD